MREKFNFFNQKYFGGRLPTPELKVAPISNGWGSYNLKAQYYKGNRKIFELPKDKNGKTSYGTLTLTSNFDRKEDAVISSLLHEMIHEYVYVILRVYPEDVHGAEFCSMADKISADGWNIEEATFMTADDKEASLNTGKPPVLLIISKAGGADFRYWVCAVDPERIPEFEATVSRLKDITSHEYYEVTAPLNGHFFDDLPKDPSTLRGWRGMSYNQIARDIANYIGIKPEILSPSALKLYKR